MISTTSEGGVSAIGSFLSGDIIFILGLFVLFFVFSMYFGKKLVASIVISFYVATILFRTFPFTDKLMFLTGDKLLTINEIFIFLLFWAPIVFLLKRYIPSESGYGGSLNIVRNTALALALLILVILLSYNLVNYDYLHDFSDIIDGIFGTQDKIFYWSLVPLLLVAFL